MDQTTIESSTTILGIILKYISEYGLPTVFGSL
jgi:hypothetical protein